MRGVTRRQNDYIAVGGISTRTPHAGSDAKGISRRKLAKISTRTPHAGSDLGAQYATVWRLLFQPALPMRGVTVLQSRYLLACLFQPALPLRGVTRE